MSAIWGKLLYDGCNNEQQVLMSIQPGMYNVFNSKYENQNNSTVSKLSCNDPELQKIKCDPCLSNSNANINNNNDLYGKKLIDIEADLKLYTRSATRCPSGKYLPGQSKDNSIVVNPYLCERSIVPTNMKMPTKSGF